MRVLKVCKWEYSWKPTMGIKELVTDDRHVWYRCIWDTSYFVCASQGVIQFLTKGLLDWRYSEIRINGMTSTFSLIINSGKFILFVLIASKFLFFFFGRSKHLYPYSRIRSIECTRSISPSFTIDWLGLWFWFSAVETVCDDYTTLLESHYITALD